MIHTKIVATIGPASRSPEMIRRMVQTGMNVARLNFSHGSYEDHAATIATLRQVSAELDTPVTLLQDLQGPKIRVGQLPNEGMELIEGNMLTLVPIDAYTEQSDTVPIDYPHLAEEAQPGTQVLMDDGLLELKVETIKASAVHCRIIKGGFLKPRKGVNLPSLNLRLPSMTDKDKEDLAFGIQQGVDWVSLSFVRKGEDIRLLKQLLSDQGADTPVIAKIEKPQAIDNLDDILSECDGVMVARGDMGVEVSPERVPLLQKRIIRKCNERGIPVITATQMLESMIHNPRPTRAEASDVANAIVDGTDAVMLSGESAVGNYPLQAVEMMTKIAREVERDLQFTNLPPAETNEAHALSEALNAIADVLPLRYVVAFSASGYSARLAASERPKATVLAVTPNEKVYHRLNLIWGVKPLLVKDWIDTFDEMLQLVEHQLKQRNLAEKGDRILIMGGLPFNQAGSTNFLKLHRIEA